VTREFWYKLQILNCNRLFSSCRPETITAQLYSNFKIINIWTKSSDVDFSRQSKSNLNTHNIYIYISFGTQEIVNLLPDKRLLLFACFYAVFKAVDLQCEINVRETQTRLCAATYPPTCKRCSKFQAFFTGSERTQRGSCPSVLRFNLRKFWTDFDNISCWFNAMQFLFVSVQSSNWTLLSHTALSKTWHVYLTHCSMWWIFSDTELTVCTVASGAISFVTIAFICNK
jgi:hypothetical protein